jgi:hypothetical protein
VDSRNVILSAAAETTAGRAFFSKALSFIGPRLRLHDRRIAYLMTSISGPQSALWPGGWLAENERRLAVSGNVAANQCVGRFSAAHPCSATLSSRTSRDPRSTGALLKSREIAREDLVCRLARERLPLSAMQKPKPGRSGTDIGSATSLSARRPPTMQV